MTYANGNHIAIINASFYYTVSGTDSTPAPPSTAHANAIQQYNGLLICSAGNDANNTDSDPQYPADYPCDNIISVASTNSNDVLAGSSNYGAVSVDLAAPGVGILSTYPPAMCSNGTHRSGHVANGYHTMGGTSMAAPHVTGVAALIKSIRPDLDAGQIKSCILKGTTTVSGLSGKCATGGRLNALTALQLAQGLSKSISLTGDFNGDGKDDWALLKSYPQSETAIQVRTSIGSIYTTTSIWWNSGVGNFNMAAVQSNVCGGDFNGDGKDDIAMMYNYGSDKASVYTLLSQGNSFSSQVWYSWPIGEFNANSVTGRFTSGDFNGDGKDDILSNYLYSHGKIKSFVQLSTGFGFTDIQEW